MTASAPSGAGARSAHRKAIGLSFAAAVGGFLFGFDSSVINGAVSAIEGEFELEATVTGLVVAVALLGCALGAWGAGRLADRIGRVKVMLLGAGLFLFSAVMSALAWTALDLSLWRFLGGIGIGIASVIAPAYIAEISPASIRGSLASLQQLAITVGIFGALLSDQILASTAGGASEELWLGWEAWRWMFFVEAVPAVVYGLLALRMPESPRYLVAKGDVGEARSVLASVLGPQEDADDRIEEIKRSIAVDEKNADLGSLKGKGFLGLKSIVWVGILLAIFQQFVGINIIFYYSTTLWQAVGFDESQAFLVSTITAITNIAVTFIAIALIDKVGRRPMLLIGSAGMAVSLLTMAAVFTQGTTTVDAAGESTLSLGDPWGTIALIAANAFVVFFGATWGPLMWVMLGEMFPNRIRAAALGVGAAANWLANFTITLTFPPMLSAFGPAVPYGMYGLFAVISFFFIWFKVSETKGKELEDMTEDVRRRV
ncbi:sugar porter family MFS transporter [Isoptericola sp. S6320L]|uniref:sugar porter family MFS transporter n=1 Tax=Isoptericola sp. S6320L TaxID=2926411 RepID=UPI001FF4CEFF|nr:sugar porter family MFS transporter [Isoptericola sp. S6320L]MCK0118383.1 sugar porter family MFS transporter [Isoptericola sp. S6320L]